MNTTKQSGNKVKLICMSFDGDYVSEGEFQSIEDAWARSSDMGSRWYFYPFHFVTTASGKTIKDACTPLEWTIGYRVKAISEHFKQAATKPEHQNMDAEQYAFAV